MILFRSENRVDLNIMIFIQQDFGIKQHTKPVGFHHMILQILTDCPLLDRAENIGVLNALKTQIDRRLCSPPNRLDHR